MKKNVKVYIICGSDEYARKSAIEEVVSEVISASQREAALTRYSITDFNESTIAQLKVPTFFADKQVVIVYGIERMKKKDIDIIRTYLENPSDHALLILEGETVPEALNKLKDPNLYIRTSKRQFENELAHVAQSIMKKSDRHINPEALTLLLERVGGSESFLRSACEKLILSSERQTEITEDMVIGLVENMSTYDVYALTNALSAKDIDQTLIVLDALIADGAKEIELIGIIGWQIRRLLEGRILHENGHSLQEIGRSLKIYPKYVRLFGDQLKKFSLVEIRHILDELTELDIRIKSGLADARRDLELLLIRLCSNQLI